ncbi:MAG: hypothetical protein D6808_03790 [Candidatus Dadabacteria bacterium]|nr:MAG: hypothetical protein D6808_03790 [Candidatus Dadabacteria bacterium]
MHPLCLFSIEKNLKFHLSSAIEILSKARWDRAIKEEEDMSLSIFVDLLSIAAVVGFLISLCNEDAERKRSVSFGKKGEARRTCSSFLV